METMIQAKKFVLTAVVAALVFSFPLRHAAAQTPVPISDASEGPTAIEATADSLEYVKGEKKIVARGNVVIVYQESKLTSDYAEVFTDTKKAYAEGHVTIYQKGGMLRGEKVFYNFKTHQGSFPNGTATQYPWSGRAEQMDQVSKDKIQLYNAVITSCPLDAGDPHYEIVAKRAVIHPGERFIAYDVKFKVLGRTVFWVPYLNIPLRQKDSPLVIQPGHSKQWGWYALLSKTFSVNDNINLRAHLDLYEKRGIGAGGDAFYNYDALRSRGFFKGYYIEDEDAPSNSNIDNNGKDNPYSQRVERRRYRITYKHRTDFDDYTNVILQYHKFSDEFFLQDFFESEYRGEIQPATFGVFTKNTERSGFFTNVNYRSNKFFDETEELPQMRFDWNNQRVGNSQLFYQNQTGLANFRQRRASIDDGDESWRFDTAHSFSLPKKIGAVEILPQAGIRDTYYSETKDKGGSANRFNFDAGIDLKTQASRIYDWSGSFLGMDFNKVRHLVEPTVGYHNTESLGVPLGDLVKFDTIDSLGTRHEAILGVENRIQTKRKYGSEWKRVDVVSLNTYMFFNAYTDRYPIQGKTAVTSVRNEMVLRPYDWLIAEWESDFNAMKSEFDRSNIDIILSYKDKYSILIGQRYIAERTDIEGSNQIVLDMSYKINSRWRVGGYVRSELEDGDLEEWEIRFTRDLSCGWFLDLGYNVRNSDIDENNSSFYARITLVPLDLSYATGSRASFANPRIGDRVSGQESHNFSKNALGQSRYRDYQNLY